MTCEDCQDRLANRPRGEALPEEARAHLETCATCRAIAAALAEVDEGLADLGPLQPPDTLVQRTLARVAAEREGKPRRASAESSRWWSWKGGMGAFATAATAVLAIVVVNRGGVGDDAAYHLSDPKPSATAARQSSAGDGDKSAAESALDQGLRLEQSGGRYALGPVPSDGLDASGERTEAGEGSEGGQIGALAGKAQRQPAGAKPVGGLVDLDANSEDPAPAANAANLAKNQPSSSATATSQDDAKRAEGRWKKRNRDSTLRDLPERPAEVASAPAAEPEPEPEALAEEESEEREDRAQANRKVTESEKKEEAPAEPRLAAKPKQKPAKQPAKPREEPPPPPADEVAREYSGEEADAAAEARNIRDSERWRRGKDGEKVKGERWNDRSNADDSRTVAAREEEGKLGDPEEGALGEGDEPTSELTAKVEVTTKAEPVEVVIDGDGYRPNANNQPVAPGTVSVLVERKDGQDNEVGDKDKEGLADGLVLRRVIDDEDGDRSKLDKADGKLGGEADKPVTLGFTAPEPPAPPKTPQPTDAPTEPMTTDQLLAGDLLRAGEDRGDDDGRDDDDEDGEGEPSFIPAQGYFANSYAPGDPALVMLEGQLSRGLMRDGRRLALERASQPPTQLLDAPGDRALALSISANRSAVSGQERVLLQVALKGSDKAVANRTALSLALLVDLRRVPTESERHALWSLADALAQSRRGDDRFTLVVAGAGAPIRVTPERFTPANVRSALVEALSARQAGAGDADLETALDAAFAAVAETTSALEEEAIPPGARHVLLATGASIPAEALDAQVHAAVVRGLSLSTLSVGPQADLEALTKLSVTGQGRRLVAMDPDRARLAARDELAAAGRVVARAVRLRIRLAEGVKLVRVLDSEPLAEPEAERVREAEVAADARLSKAFGIKSDRGEDEEGIQIVIPAFMARDAHVILLDVQVPGAGPIADVRVRYKDLIRTANGVESAALSLPAGPHASSPLTRNVEKNLVGLAVTRGLEQAARAARLGRWGQAEAKIGAAYRAVASLLEREPGLASDEDLQRDRAMLAEYAQVLADHGRWQHSAEIVSYVETSLEVATRRRRLGSPSH